jgi:hypothetical protein
MQRLTRGTGVNLESSGDVDLRFRVAPNRFCVEVKLVANVEDLVGDLEESRVEDDPGAGGLRQLSWTERSDQSEEAKDAFVGESLRVGNERRHFACSKGKHLDQMLPISYRSKATYELSAGRTS